LLKDIKEERKMTENQKRWLEELIDEHSVAASNERLWAKGAPDQETAQMHEENAEEHIEFAQLLGTLLEENL
jgi:hypothetical protein